MYIYNTVDKKGVEKMKLEIECGCLKKLNKQNRNLKNEVLRAAKRVGERIVDYSNEGVSFENIYNDNVVKYDKHGCFFTYKHHGKNKSQIRLLYACLQDKDKTTIIVVDFFEKRDSSRSNTKEHIKIFNCYNSINLQRYFLQNKSIVLA